MRITKCLLKQSTIWVRLLTTPRILDVNPAASVRGPRYIVKRGKTPLLSHLHAEIQSISLLGKGKKIRDAAAQYFPLELEAVSPDMVPTTPSATRRHTLTPVGPDHAPSSDPAGRTRQTLPDVVRRSRENQDLKQKIRFSDQPHRIVMAENVSWRVARAN